MHYLWLGTVFFILFQLACASIRNITVDDLLGDSTGRTIIYEPQGAWMSGAIGGCPTCSAPISQSASNGTFHGSIFNARNKNNNDNPLTASFTFFGTSVSVNCILSNSLSNPPGNSDMTFLIDGIQAGTFSYSPTGASDFRPSNVFVSKDLPLLNHTLVIQNGRPGGRESLVILDSLTYLVDDDLPTVTMSGTPASGVTSPTATAVSGASTNKSNSAAIAGGVIGALAVVLVVVFVLLYLRHRRNQHRSNVPLSTSILSPLGRIGRLWSAVQQPPKPPPDMAPVPFPTPTPRVTRNPRPRPPPLAPPATAPSESRMSRISFNANMLVGRFQRRRPPPPAITTRQVANPNPSASAPHSLPVTPALPSSNPILRPPSAQPPPEPHNVVTSIQEWQRRTLEETANQPVIHPLDMSEVDLSSHYDESSVSGPPPPPAPPPPRSPQPPQRRFTVMNN
ncbi:hypothetical protein DFH06DRAFT_538901 [Mycena polygramma]|nr:hypothetical protein DFH06DRAFT_538901 [Mycena polygramma]